MQEPIVRSGFLSRPFHFSRFAVGLLVRPEERE
jgi:hypothetical protein